MDPVLSEMLLELHERILNLRRALGQRLVGSALSEFYRMDAMYHVLYEEVRDGDYVETTSSPPEFSAEAEGGVREDTHDDLWDSSGDDEPV